MLRDRAARLVIGFGGAILVGAALLMLPAAAESGAATGVVTALFTATSAVCVTDGWAAAAADRFATGHGMSWGRVAYEGVFHSISAFNNAGFALYGGSLAQSWLRHSSAVTSSSWRVGRARWSRSPT